MTVLTDPDQFEAITKGMSKGLKKPRTIRVVPAFSLNFGGVWFKTYHIKVKTCPV